MSELQIEIKGNWESFHPREYLEMWYARTTPEISATLGFLRYAYLQATPGARVLDFCCGPTIYQHLAAAPLVAEIHCADYLQRNLDEIRRWRDGGPDAFDWTPLIHEALWQEGLRHPAAEDIARRADIVRSRLTALEWCDIRQPDPLGRPLGRAYDVVSNCYGADVVAATVEEWEDCVANCCSLLKPGGMLIMTLIKDAEWWPSGDQIMPALRLNELHVMNALTKIGFVPSSITTSTHTVDDASQVGYSDVIFVTATLADNVDEEPRSA
ncbi:MAG TPA: guanitoxin biosynthesis pre-guanitoxin forming N-methyltransferase GntF [Herpetosiphonaceae bacterium]|nr:guanitoxin biosynthesis pre-guanitoxin forming N-methyltransferase GntF [Herpetosiphonaceae bacterium]